MSWSAYIVSCLLIVFLWVSWIVYPPHAYVATASSVSIPLTNFVVETVHDGDTVSVTFKDVPDVLGKNIGIRLFGIDAPELSDRDPCVRNMAKISRDVLSAFLKNGKTIELSTPRRDKYFRLDGDFLVDGKSAVQHLLLLKRAQPYTGKGPKPLWTCDPSWFTPSQ